MHILVINDDGPPNSTASPYVHSFINALRARNHTVSVVLPHEQRSWIGKAHFPHSTATPSYFRPGTVHEDNGTVSATPLPSTSTSDEWVLIDGTPATCAQLGLYHFYQDRGPVDLVVSGPNFGRNSTSLFALSSGTVGGAMEAACCGKKAVAVSFAFAKEARYRRDFIEAGCRLGARLCEYLVGNWGEGVDLYNVNIPLVEGLEGRKVFWTSMLQNWWRSGSAYRPVEGKGKRDVQAEHGDDAEAETREMEGREDEQSVRGKREASEFSRHEHRQFKWVPSFADVNDSVRKSGEGTDGWAILNDATSVTPLKANFMHAISQKGELKL